MPRIPLINRSPLALLYFLMFTGLSFTTHASVTAVTKIVSGDPPHLTIGYPELLGEGDGPYGLAVIALMDALLISSEVWGWPGTAAVEHVLER